MRRAVKGKINASSTLHFSLAFGDSPPPSETLSYRDGVHPVGVDHIPRPPFFSTTNHSPDPTWAHRPRAAALSVPPQGSRELKEFRLIQIGHDPVRRLRAVPVEDLVALRVLFLNGVVGCAMIWP